MLHLAVLSRVPPNAANLAWVQSPQARADIILPRLNYYHLIPENVVSVFGGTIVAELSSTTFPTDQLLISNRSVVHRDVRTPQPLYYVHRVGKDILTGSARYQVQNSEAGAAATLDEARLILLRALQITDQAGNVDRSLNWDLEIISKSGDRFVIDLYFDRLQQQRISLTLKYNAWDTVGGQLLSNHIEILNPSPIDCSIGISESSTGQFYLSSIPSGFWAPGIALFSGTGTPTDIVVSATGIDIGATGLSRGLPIAELASKITSLTDGVSATPLSPSAAEALSTGTYVATSYGTVVRQTDIAHIKLDDSTLIEVRPFRQLRPQEPWYARIGTGTFVRTFGDVEYIYSIPEFEDQTFSTRHGAGQYREVSDESPRILGEYTLQVTRTPIFDATNIKLRGAGETDITSIIKDVDLQNGIIFTTERVSDNDEVRVDYAYSEDAYEYRGINLNPTLDHNPEVVEKLVGIYIVPSKIRRVGGSPATLAEQDQTVFHILGDSVAEIKSALADTSLTFTAPDDSSDVLYRPILLAIIQPVQTAGVDSVRVVDTRTRGGGVVESLPKGQFPIREGEMFWDIGFWEGKPFQQMPVTVVDFPDELIGTGQPSVTETFPVPSGVTAPTDMLSLEEIQRRADKYRAAGSIAIMNPRQDLTVPTGV